MLILAIDTSGRQGSVALCRDDVENFQVLQLTLIEGGTYSAQLMPVIAGMLAQNGVANTAIDGFAVVSGPGSFTGLRVGLATVKGLCEVLEKPLVTVSVLEAIALTYGSPGETVSTILDAGRGEIYVGDYQVVAGGAVRLRECVAKLEEFAADSGTTSRNVLTTDPAIAKFLREAGAAVRLVAPLQADQVGRIGIDKLRLGEVADAATVDVNYIRRSNAEIFATPKR